MLAIVPKLRATLIESIEQGTPDEIAQIVGALAGNRTVVNGHGQLRASGLARLPFAKRAIKLDAGGRPLERDDEPHAALYDPLLDLTWLRGDLTQKDEVSQDSADALAKACRLFGLEDWRLPTVFEFQSIVDRTRHSPAVDPALFDVKSDWYWTSEVYAPDPANRWCVYLSNGYTHGLFRYHAAFARAVRAGQPFEFRY